MGRNKTYQDYVDELNSAITDESRKWIPHEDSKLLEAPTLLPPVQKKLHKVELLMSPLTTSTKMRILERQSAVEEEIKSSDLSKQNVSKAILDSKTMWLLDVEITMMQVIAWRSIDPENLIDFPPGVGFVQDYDDAAVDALCQQIAEIGKEVVDESRKKSSLNSFNIVEIVKEAKAKQKQQQEETQKQQQSTNNKPPTSKTQ